MCGRFTQQRPTAELAELFEARPLVEDPGARFNVAPTQDALVIVERDGERRLTAYRWGLVPAWSTGPSAGSKLFNARSETLATSPAFRDAFRRRRCLVPVDAFYEWRREGARRQPFLIRSKDGAPLALAGLWATWRDPETAQRHRSFTIVTTGPNEVIAALHDRMPVILDRSTWGRWLDTTTPDSGELEGFLAPCPSELLDVYPVARFVNDVRNEGPELVRPIASDGDPAALGA